MPVVNLTESAAAAWTVGTNAMAGNRCQNSPFFRNLAKIGVTGSAAAGDFEVEAYWGNTFIGNFKNTTLGAAILPLEARDFISCPAKLWALPNESLNLMVTDASGTNAAHITLVIEESRKPGW